MREHIFKSTSARDVRPDRERAECAKARRGRRSVESMSSVTFMLLNEHTEAADHVV